jgi:hypothetical protein
VRKIHGMPTDPNSGNGPTRGQMLVNSVVIYRAARVAE